MQKKSIKELEEKYDFELEKIIKEINKTNSKLVLLQFADGLKPYSTIIVDYLREKTDNKVEFLIWIETCFGACDTPVLPKELEEKIDLCFQFGHNKIMPGY